MLSRRTLAAACVLLIAQAAYSQQDTDAKYVKDLNGGDVRTQFTAATRLGGFRTKLSVNALVTRLTTPEANAVVRSACATSLGKLRVNETYGVLHNAAKDTKEPGIVRASCIRSMAGIKQNEAVEDLATILKTDKSTFATRTLVEVLGGMTDRDRVTTAIAPLLKDPDSAPPAIAILGAVGGPGTVIPLAEMLKDRVSMIRLAAIEALGKVKDPRAVPPLMKFYENANEAEKGEILSALSEYDKPEVVVLMMKQLLDVNSLKALRLQSALGLGKLRARPAIKAMVALMLHPKESLEIREACTKALGNFNSYDDYAVVVLIGALT